MSSLFVDRRAVHLELESGAIVFRENGERIGTVPIAPLTRVFLRGEVTLCAKLLGKLGEQGVGVVVLSGRQGKPSLMLARPHNDASRRVEQIRKSLDAGFCLGFARDLIDRKVSRQIHAQTLHKSELERVARKATNWLLVPSDRRSRFGLFDAA